jgi:hypothetical protein
LLAAGALRRRQAAAAGAETVASSRLVLPYGPALAVAAMILLRDSPWAAAL